jgi:hypothetical protein
MHEVLSKPDFEKLPRSEQEFYELRIDDSDDSWRPAFVVKQTRIGWSESDERFLWEESELEYVPTIKHAQERYKSCHQALGAKGFTESDMAPF